MDTDFSTFRLLAALLAAIACTSWVVQRSTGPNAAPGLLMPGRRLAAFGLLSFMLLLACFHPLLFWDQPPEIDPEQVWIPSLFLLQTLLLVTVTGWFLAAFAGLPEVRRVWVRPRSVEDSLGELLGGEIVPPPEQESVQSLDVSDDSEEGSVGAPIGEPVEVIERVHQGWWRELRRQCGLEAERPVHEVLLGVVLGVGVWFGLMVTLMVFGALFVVLFGPDALPEQGAAEGVLLIVGLPVWVRIALSVAAGVSEEIFFRGFLQARLGIVVASLLFSCAHLGYGQPAMLIGLTLLSFAFAFIVRWRGNVLAVIVAHAVFDLIQMLVMIPLFTELQEMLPELEELSGAAVSLSRVLLSGGALAAGIG